MTERRRTELWSAQQAMVLMAACLMAGIAGGWMLRMWKSPFAAGASQPVSAKVTPRIATADAAPDAVPLRSTVDAEAAPLLSKLAGAPGNADLLTTLGNLYYDAQQYGTAIEYYDRALKARPDDVSVRTDAGTAYWYSGNADAAIAELNEALVYAPENANTLFNRGLILWQGKGNRAAALADWKKLLASHPDYEGRARVEQLIAEAEEHTAPKTQ